MSSINWITQRLNEYHVPYKEVHHKQAFTAQQVALKEHFDSAQTVKVVVVITDGKPATLILPATRYVSLEQVKRLLGAQQIRLANEEEMQFYFPECEVGAIPPLPHWKHIDMLMDPSMRVRGEILFQGGTHTDAIEMRFDDWFALVKPRIGEFATPSKNF
ncbi:MAG: YbaK/EbsC family protein [Deltaproteobacteria bacterium]|nr:YbaK/EbsC family protein [Deltaproteobacteria bacterium]